MVIIPLTCLTSIVLLFSRRHVGRGRQGGWLQENTSKMSIHAVDSSLPMNDTHPLTIESGSLSPGSMTTKYPACRCYSMLHYTAYSVTVSALGFQTSRVHVYLAQPLQ
eukprot:scpid61864/ scgid16247/ 